MLLLTFFTFLSIKYGTFSEILIIIILLICLLNLIIYYGRTIRCVTERLVTTLKVNFKPSSKKVDNGNVTALIKTRKLLLLQQLRHLIKISPRWTSCCDKSVGISDFLSCQISNEIMIYIIGNWCANCQLVSV